ncbi:MULTISPECIES: DUF441 domain-containing protein [Kerstersia]|jgi:uncharacterized membrane protein (DUF441 family)|uniref:UPF0756 membrane protein AAV32_06310 n=1 Tax=Kerstersia gyiorum TaxID=206506 RepID=A0A171KUQ8_9BURK|nr:DUF441 domain-containing protein [Kerstersia gyiorum]AZV93207.1 DUF441 family protein [Bordetella sp. J329]MCO7642763.1 DUF441 domain-containing protein [Pseudomonas sp. S 311-6]KAB0543580.1 DUF441 domain-containing protein [Kerstersia gyiorum]KKO72625.1 membrane protein [Kerstersia gyiorum]MCH4272186.1 DUF441 domain-containing protein [Kerstersia gyiorum]
MSWADPTILLLLAFAVLGYVSHNMAVSIAMLVLLFVRLTPLQAHFPWVQKYGLSVGIIILMVGVMTPIASGRISVSDLLHSFVEWRSFLAVLVGIGVAWLGGRGVVLMGNSPQIVAGLLMGTLIGVAFFRGVPVGPLIAAGLLSLLIGKS